MGLDNFKGHF